MQPVIERISKGFPILLLTGMRQVGKSWLMNHLAERGRKYVSLDDLKARDLAKMTLKDLFRNISLLL
jgi:predicted AAA+ superfamily ATPase